MLRISRLVALLGVAALAVPAAAVAKDGDDHRRGAQKAEDHAHAHGKADDHGRRHGAKKPATFVFKGVYGTDGAVTVKGGNSRVRKNGFVGKVVIFDLSAAKLAVADVDGDGAATVADLQAGDRVVVQARLPRALDAADAGTLAARKLVDQTHPRSHDDDVDDDAPATATP